MEGGEREILNLLFRALLQEISLLYGGNALMDQGAFMVSISCCVQLLPFILVLHGGSHRRTGNFLPGGGGVGAVNHLPKKFSQVSQIFTKESKRNEGHIVTT